jgi:hypothetical protein
MNPGQFFLQGGWVMFIPVLVLIFLLILTKRKITKTEQKVTNKTHAAPAGGELPRWVTLLTGCICLLLSSGGIWLGIMGIVGRYFGSYSNRHFHGLCEISGFIAILLGILSVILSVGAFIVAFILLNEGLFAKQVKHE